MACVQVVATRVGRTSHPFVDGMWTHARFVFFFRQPTASDWTKVELGNRINCDWVEETLDSTVTSPPSWRP